MSSRPVTKKWSPISNTQKKSSLITVLAFSIKILQTLYLSLSIPCFSALINGIHFQFPTVCHYLHIEKTNWFLYIDSSILEAEVFIAMFEDWQGGTSFANLKSTMNQKTPHYF